MSAPSAVRSNRVLRVEDADLLKGAARFVDDLHLSGMLQAAFVRSPHGHAKVLSIDTSMAKDVPGVHAVLTRDDFLPHLATEFIVVGLPSPAYRQDINRPALSGLEVVHVGEPVAIVLADNRYIAEDAAALVMVDYDPLPAVGDPREALKPGAPLVHSSSPHNLLAEFDMGYGDVDAAFAGAPHVFKESLWQHRGGSHSIECRGDVAAYDSFADTLTLWSSTQTPHAARSVLAGMLGWDEDRIRVVTPDVGGGFGPKLIFYPEDVAVALAAYITRRPVKWIEDRREHFVATTQERDQYWDAEIAVDNDGKILGLRGSIVHDHGAYTARGVNLPYESAQTVTLAYEIPTYQMNVKLALTNKVPVTPVRGAGQPQGVFCMERLLDRAADELKIPRAELRRRNLIPGDKMPYTKPLKSRGGRQVVLDSGDYPKCQADALEKAGAADFAVRQAAARKEGRYIGLGLANFVKGTGRGPFEPVTVRVDPSTGQIIVYSGATAMGQSTKTMFAQVVAEQLGGDITRVTAKPGDTGTMSMGLGGFNSRLTVMAGSSAHLAATKVRDKALLIASKLLKLPAEELQIHGGQVEAKADPSKSVTLGQLAKSVAGVAGFVLPDGVSPGLEATEYFVVDDMAYANGAAAIEVEVDVETGGVHINKFVIAHDCGAVINPMLVDGQIVGAAAHGIGNALYEWMGYDDNCQPVTTNLGEYLLVTAPEVPLIEVSHHESPTYLNPLGVKGVGECGVVPVAPAIMSAIEDALREFDVHIAQTPITPGEIVAKIEAGRKAKA
ncbi:MAG TPA: xanthine dehydrogenase family protein molybdopterin-binding subunit [Alphaproteobacteria bacterium]|jgi:carbon-monoxide dehydrogenase large subunit